MPLNFTFNSLWSWGCCGIQLDIHIPCFCPCNDIQLEHCLWIGALSLNGMHLECEGWHEIQNCFDLYFWQWSWYLANFAFVIVIQVIFQFVLSLEFKFHDDANFIWLDRWHWSWHLTWCSFSFVINLAFIFVGNMTIFFFMHTNRICKYLCIKFKCY